MKPAASSRSRYRALPATAAGVAAPFVARALLGPLPADAHGAPILLSSLLDIASALALFAAAVGLGESILDLLRTETASPLERLVLCAASGSAALGSALFILAFWAPLTRGLLLAVPLLAAALSAPGLLRAARVLRSAGAELWNRAGPICTLVSAAALTFMLVQALPPTTDWDSLMYHLQVPAGLLRGGTAAVLDNPHTAFVGPAQALYLPFLATGASAGPALLSVIYTALLAAVVLLTGDRIATGLGGLSTTLLWGSMMVIAVGMTPRVDIALAFYLLLAQYLLLEAEPADASRLLVAAGLAGYAVAIKYHALIFVAALWPLLVLRARRLSRPRPWKWIGLATLVGAVVAMPPLLKNALLFGDPVYPFLRGPRAPHWLATLAPAPTGSEGLDLFRVYLAATSPFDLRGWFLNPAPMTPEAEGLLYRANPIFLALPLLLLFRNRAVAWLVLPAIAYLGIVLGFEASGNLRYLLPALAPFTIGSAYALRCLALRLRPSRDRPGDGDSGRARPRPGPLGRALLAMAGAAALAFPAIAATAMLARRDRLAYDVGALSRREYLSREMPGLGALIPILNRRLSSRDTLLMLYEARGFYLNAHVIEDNFASNWPRIAERLGAERCLPRSTASFVLVDWDAERFFLRRGAPRSLLRPAQLRDFARRCLKPVFEGASYSLYRVPPGGPAAAERQAEPASTR